MEEVGILTMEDGGCLDLPPGFRFHPTDEEIITSYLLEKVKNKSFSARAIGEVDLNRCEPWDLPSKAKMGKKEWYFFCQRDRKYPTGMRTNRATESGYWKATGKDKEIYKGKNWLVGMKKTLVFYKGRAPKGEKTNWVMHEYRLEGKSLHCNLPKAAKDAWVVCRVFHKNTPGLNKSPLPKPVRTDSFAPVKPPFEDDYLLGSIQSLLESPNYLSSDEGDFKPNPPSSSNPSYFPSSVGMEGLQDLHNSFLVNNAYLNTSPQVNLYSVNPPQGPMFHPQAFFPSTSHSLPRPPSMGFLHQPGGMNPGFLLHDHATPRVRAAPQEQVSNQTSTLVSASQDTGLSADWNTEISSVVVSKHGGVGGSRPYDDVVDCPSDMETLWKY